MSRDKGMRVTNQYAAYLEDGPLGGKFFPVNHLTGTIRFPSLKAPPPGYYEYVQTEERGIYRYAPAEDAKHTEKGEGA